MSEGLFAFDKATLQAAVVDRRFTALGRLGVDLASIGTWDRFLSRETRILVPADVQAFVVRADGTETTVPITGDQRDPQPFTDGDLPSPGVHLHWALPDALLRGQQSKTEKKLALPALPDRWVVVRALLPKGRVQALLRGWVIDAKLGSVTPLETYAGTPATAPANTPTFDPLDGAIGGSLHWTASYTAAAGRFAFHDPLDDLDGLRESAPDGFFADQAVYTVAGWWTNATEDPLAGLFGSVRLDQRLGEKGWMVVHDGDDEVRVEPDERLVKLRTALGLHSPVQVAKVNVVTNDGREVARFNEYRIEARSPVLDAHEVIVAPPLPTYSTLVHGSVLGVPILGALPQADDRPEPTSIGTAIGIDLDDVVAAFSTPAFQIDAAHRSSLERLVAAFTSGLLERLGSADGLEDLDEHEHGDGFWSFAGKPLPATKPDRLRAADSAPVGPLTVGRKGRAAHRSKGFTDDIAAELSWMTEVGVGFTKMKGSGVKRARRLEEAIGPDTAAATADAREVVKAAPRYFRPQAPMLALRGARPNHRHHGDGLYDERGLLRCRYPKECVPGIDGVVTGSQVVPSLGSGAIPDEVTAVVREAVVLNPYGYQWLAQAGAEGDAGRASAYTTRLAGEMVRLYGTNGTYDGSSHLIASTQKAGASSWESVSSSYRLLDSQISVELSNHSLIAGTPPSPVALTTWRQPWVPLWLEWRVTLDGDDTLSGWELTGLDMQPGTPAPSTPKTFTFLGRSPISQGISKTLQKAITGWVKTEQQRVATDRTALSSADRDLLTRLGDYIAPLDLVSASMDGIREQLLGIPYVGVLDRPDPGDGSKPLPQATGKPTPMFSGTLTVEALRLVDAFGRTQDVPVETLNTTSELLVDGLDTGIRMRPRIQHAARWLYRLVDPAQPPGTDPAALHEAFVDQLDPSLAVNPVAGFLLPDHIDEALEAFTVAGDPIGQVQHDAVSGAVSWEPAPGRAVPPDAGPLADLAAHDRFVGEIAAGLVRADAENRSTAAAGSASTLTALLRAVDTTLWSVDTFAAVGSPTVAGLVGRPIAVVRASLLLDVPDDVDEVDVTAPGGAEARRKAFAKLAEQRFPVHLGVLARSDDSLLGFYVNDDYEHLHLVDKVVATKNIASGRHLGYLGLLGAPVELSPDQFDHPYLVEDDTIWIRPGQTVMLTLLMLPAGRVHLTSGILPRKALQLSDGWVSPGLRRLVPSVRVGPLLVDPAEIRLPLVSTLGDKQTFTRRTGPLTWRDDPIVAATQTAYLPRLPHEAQEGWVRVTPVDPNAAGTAGGS
jgi:hypothetical protein